MSVVMNFREFDDYQRREAERMFRPQPGNVQVKRVNKTRLYQLLSISRSFPCEQVPFVLDNILEHQFDSRPESQQQEILFAAEVLSNPQTRHLYDKDGEDALDEIRRILGEDKKDTGKKVENTEIDLDVTLSDVYLGAEKQFEGTRRRMCKRCVGRGSIRLMSCPHCSGQGQTTSQRSSGGLVTENCAKCDGSGSIADPAVTCPVCNGAKMKEETFPVFLELKKGSPNHSKYRYKGEGSQEIGQQPGDFVVKINYVIPPDVKVKDGDVTIQRSITFSQSITGYRLPYLHLDGSQHTLSSLPGEVTPNNCYRSFRGLGLPIFDRPGTYGSLIVDFIVIPPEPLTPYAVSILRELLPHGEIVNPDGYARGFKHLLIEYSERQVSKEQEVKNPEEQQQEEEEEERKRREQGRQECSGSIF